MTLPRSTAGPAYADPAMLIHRLRLIGDRIRRRFARPAAPVNLERRLGYGPVRSNLLAAIADLDDDAAARLAAAIAPHLEAELDRRRTDPPIRLRRGEPR